MKRHYIFASHGSFANGLLNSVELILGKQPDIHTLCAYVEEEVDLTQQVEALGKVRISRSFLPKLTR